MMQIFHHNSYWLMDIFTSRTREKKITMMVSIIHMYKNGRRTLKCSSNTINQAQIRTMCNVHHHNTKKLLHIKKRIKKQHQERIFIFYIFLHDTRPKFLSFFCLCFVVRIVQYAPKKIIVQAFSIWFLTRTLI